MASLPSIPVQLHAFPSTYSAAVYLLSLAALSSLYGVASTLCGFLDFEDATGTKEEQRKEQLRRCKMRSWILTGAAAAVMTAGSLPFVWDLLRSGLDVGAVQPRRMLSEGVVAFFMAYLQLDLAVGCLPVVGYRGQISMLTGWVHHLAYTVLLWVIMRRGLSHVFAGAAIMELPTLVLASSMLLPSTRNDLLFASLFFITRIFYHCILLILYYTPYGRLHGGGLASLASPSATWIPAIGLTLAAPLHITWFISSTRGMLRRRRAARLPLISATPAPRSPLLLPQKRPRLVSLASSYLNSPRPTLLRLRSTSTSAKIEREVSDYFTRLRSSLPEPAQDWLARDSRDVLKHQAGPGVTLARMRMRAGAGAGEMKRLGGRVRRMVGAA